MPCQGVAVFCTVNSSPQRREEIVVRKKRLCPHVPRAVSHRAVASSVAGTTRGSCNRRLAWLNSPATGPSQAQSTATWVPEAHLLEVGSTGAAAGPWASRVLSLRSERKVRSVRRGRLVGPGFRRGRSPVHMVHDVRSGAKLGQEGRGSAGVGKLSWFTHGKYFSGMWTGRTLAGRLCQRLVMSARIDRRAPELPRS